jgi:hypothetical protein
MRRAESQAIEEDLAFSLFKSSNESKQPPSQFADRQSDEQEFKISDLTPRNG